MPTPAPWETRIHRTVLIGLWVALVAGVVSHAFETKGSAIFWVTLALAAVYVGGNGAVQIDRYRQRFGTETITLAGAVVGAIVIVLSGGPNSPYILLTVGAPILGALMGGFRAGLLSGTLASLLVAIITVAQGYELVEALPAVALYLAFVLLVGVIRRLLEDLQTEATLLASEKESATQQLERLEQIHQALVKLAEDASAGRLNAVAVAASTLDDILGRFPGSAGRLIVYSDSGPVVLAARGIPDDNGSSYTLPLATSDSTVGELVLTTSTELAEQDLDEIRSVIHPVSVALANHQLLQGIVGAAVTEERLRLARDLHDEIGPALASLGLALDLTAMQQASNPEVAYDIQVLRSNVTKLVEDVRASVADLRVEPGPTLTARLAQAFGQFEGPPTVVVDLIERRPPRAAIIADLTAIIVEAARNAHIHSGAGKIVVTGQVDRTFGRCSVVDDGVGFDPDHEPEGHYGLIGMRERASKIGATIKFDSKVGAGTTVTVEWGNR
ncbi:MAG TPA: histidine kinase [Acidimicrobiia bacterium]